MYRYISNAVIACLLLFAVDVWGWQLVNSGCIPSEPGTETSCSDGLDNDCDGLIDSADTSDCGGGAVELTGTPTAVVWASGADPAAQNISIPADATAVYMFYAFWRDATAAGLSSATLNSNAPDDAYDLGGTGSLGATGVAAWYNPSTGTQSLDVAWTGAPAEGPVCIVAFVKGGNTTAWRDVGADHGSSSEVVSAGVDSTATDLVLAFNQRYDEVPTLPTGWTSRQTTNNNSEYARLCSADSPGAATTTYTSTGSEVYDSVAVVSIPD